MEPQEKLHGRIIASFNKQAFLTLIGAELEYVEKGKVVNCCKHKETLSDVIEHFGVNDDEILEGPIQRTGTAGTIKSVYFRDPDGNLVEVSNYGNA